MTNDCGYTLDTGAAKSAETIGKYIRETGKYKGKFTRAELLISQAKGSRGIEFDFLSDEGKECTLQIWTHSGTGEAYSGINMVNAIMTCLSLRGIQPKPMVVEKYDYDSKQKVRANIEAFGDLMNKPIGLLLQKEISEYQGKDKTKMLIFAAFNASSEKTASEIIDKVAQPVALEKLLSGLHDKDARGKTASAPQSSAPRQSQPPACDFDDDLPF